ncbi:MAG: hypothetical protein ACQPRJ_01090 [Solitalea-like symbiont of Acarus siro]
MKKILLLTTLLSFSIIGCNKDESLKPDGSQNEQKSLRNYLRVENYLISNCSSSNSSYIFPDRNDDMTWVWDTEALEDPLKLAWTMEYLDHNFIKFWAQNKGFGQRQRVLDIDWRRPNDNGTTNAVMLQINSDPNQEWNLIGEKDIESGVIKFFRGVMVNKYTGQMLQLASRIENGKRRKYAVVGELYKGSDEEKQYNTYGNFYQFCSNAKKNTIWIIKNR